MKNLTLVGAGLLLALVACSSEYGNDNGATAKEYDGPTETVVLAVEGMT